MRSSHVNVTGKIDGNVTFPDEVVFAFNPLYCIVELSDNINNLMFAVSDGTHTRAIDIKLLNGKAQIYFSRIVQLFFDDVKHIRTKSITIELHGGIGCIFSTTLLVIWGSLALGEAFGPYGVYKDSGKEYYECKRVWFRKFPFAVSMFSAASNPKVAGAIDGGIPKTISGYGSSVKISSGNLNRFGLFELVPSVDFPTAKNKAAYGLGGLGDASTFDSTYDFTFQLPGKGSFIVNLEVCDNEDGFYLRWLDRHGCIQYFLFVKGTSTVKNTLDKFIVSYDSEEVEGMHFANQNRNSHVDGAITCKCCANALPDEIYEYVSSIVTSPMIDLYGGKTSDGKEIWIPVNIVASNHEYNHKKVLNDLIISFTMPDINAQTI